VNVDFLLDAGNLMVTVTDEGKGFKPSEKPDPTLLKILKHLQDEVYF
jgi:signal transduction histidine kinase